jgi:acyl-CoA synthetase (AMP-forming)/AMP-acid ligase II
MNICDRLLSRGKDSAPAVLYGETVVTYGELRDQVGRLASALLEQGHQKGDRIGLYSENSPFFVIAYLAIAHAGLVIVPFQVDLGAEIFRTVVSDAGISRILVSNRFSARLQALVGDLGVTLLPEAALDKLPSNATARMPEIDEHHDLATLMFTSGSTGEPKGVMVSHRNIECNTRDIVSYLGLTNEDRVMVVLPFHYCFGASLLHTHLAAGASMILNNNFKLYPEIVLQEMQQKGCTGLAGVPSTYQLLLRKSRFRQMSFPGLRWLQQAGGKLPNPCIQELLSAFPQVQFFLMYGQTEATARLSYLPPARLYDKLGSIGKGLPSTQLEVLRPNGSPVTPGSDETGEIVASGDNIALGYWNDPQETAQYFHEGRLRTGDLARVDTDGFIFIVEREREMIKSGGNRVSSKEVEDVIAEIPEVVEVAVVGIPHELLGEAITAFIVPMPGGNLTTELVMAHCRRRLPQYKLPEELVLLQSMPHNSSGKVLKSKLKELIQNAGVAEAVPVGEPAS